MNDMTVGEWCTANVGDFSVLLDGGWKVGVTRGLLSGFESSDRNMSDDILFLQWRGFRVFRSAHSVYNQKMGVLVDELRAVMLKKVREHLRVEHERIAGELDELGALEVALLGAGL